MENNKIASDNNNSIPFITDMFADLLISANIVINYNFQPKYLKALKRIKCIFFGHNWMISRLNDKPFICRRCTKYYK
mgnify:CR=1 FL=1